MLTNSSESASRWPAEEGCEGLPVFAYELELFVVGVLNLGYRVQVKAV
jgi:hypothetical protein